METRNQIKLEVLKFLRPYKFLVHFGGNFIYL